MNKRESEKDQEYEEVARLKEGFRLRRRTPDTNDRPVSGLPASGITHAEYQAGGGVPITEEVSRTVETPLMTEDEDLPKINTEAILNQIFEVE
jgi:hypothetical protein